MELSEANQTSGLSRKKVIIKFITLSLGVYIYVSIHEVKEKLFLSPETFLVLSLASRHQCKHLWDSAVSIPTALNKNLVHPRTFVWLTELSPQPFLIQS